MRAFSCLALLLCTAPAAAQTVSLDSVERALAAGASWHASQLLAPRLGSAEGRTPEVIIAAARAAGGWEGWSTVERLLGGVDWLDSRFDRIGHRLLAEAALADNKTATALNHARASLPRSLLPRSDAEAARRWILLARAHERATNWDSAAAGYTRAAALSPDIADWLALRAANVSRDSATRHRLYATVTSSPARSRVDWTEAAALARFDQRAAAARVFRRVGAEATALRLEWEVNRDAATRARLSTALLDLARRGTPAAEARQALEIIAGYSVPMARSESLTVARSAGTLGRAAQSAQWFTALARGGTLSSGDLVAWGDAEAALGRWANAARTYRRVTTGSNAGRAAYLAARADLRGGQSTNAISQLNRIPARFPNDTFAAGTALYLLGDLALDAGRIDSTRRLFRRIVADYPSSEYAERAALIAPLIAFGNGEYATTRRELETALSGRLLVGFAADAGRYWLARSAAALGDTATANGHFRTLIGLGPENYYALRAAARLGVSPWTAAAQLPTVSAPRDPALDRAALLEQLGLDGEARQELDGVAARATTADQMLTAAAGFLELGHPSRATRIAQQALRAGAPRDPTTWRYVYPLPFQPALRSASATARVDPWLVAALIRQESGFEPHATSGAGARGLMQMMPANGPALARTIGLTDYDAALLWQPDVNLAMGTRHFAEALRRYPDLERALAAYNAGGSRVVRWSGTLLTGKTSDDPAFDVELFVERIPYLETRGYIRNITVNAAMYRLLYGSQSP